MGSLKYVPMYLELGYNCIIYDLRGQLVRRNGTTEGLPAGIYVVNGKKVMVK